MNQQLARELINDVFTQQFDRTRYENFIRNLLNRFESRDGHYTGTYSPHAFQDHVKQYWRFGKYIDPHGHELDLLVVEVPDTVKLERARSALRNFAVDRLKQFEKDASLIAFYAKDDPSDWRFSFVKIEHEVYKDKKGKARFKQELTPAKRYSYLVGKHENSHTACRQLMPVLMMDHADPTVEEIEKAFSVEKVTDEFFDQYKALFQNLVEHFKKQLEFPRATNDDPNKAIERFAKKLLGQIVFLYFLQKKGWLGAPQGEKWGKGSRRFLWERFETVTQSGGNYYKDFLQYLFYEALASERKNQPDPGYYARFKCRVPFLNGGLFEADHDWRNAAMEIPNTLFHNGERTKEGDRGTGILDVFERYNFTIKEDEPLDKEVAVDPEMLGKVFENMLEVTERKSKGAFYTPREIVHYMCQESLIYYLDSRLNGIDNGTAVTSGKQADREDGSAHPSEGGRERARVPKTDIETLIRKGNLAVEHETLAITKDKQPQAPDFRLPESVRKYANAIDDALSDIKVCDPAIGSGAFPVGMLHEIVNTRLALRPHSGVDWSAYQLKRHAIADSLYGVDIDASAIDIARLRLWLSLIVDEEDYDTIEALPNLDYKIVCGDSLLGIGEPVLNYHVFTDIEKKKKEHFSTTNHDQKAKLATEINALIFDISQGNTIFDFEIYFSEVCRRRGGFDVVIGNPPYVRADRDAKHLVHRQAILQTKRYKTLWEKWDLYIPFIEKGYQLLKDGGVTTMIVSDAYCHAKYAQKSHKWFLQNSKVLRLDFLSKIELFDAGVRNVTYFFQKGDGALNEPERRLHDPVFGAITQLSTSKQSNLEIRTFFPDYRTDSAPSVTTVALSQVFYITYGLRPSSDENLSGDSFVTVDLLSETWDEIHSRPYVDGKHLSRWVPAKNVWIEWGTHRAPSLFYRRTFDELYEVPEKILAQRSPGPVPKACYDNKKLIFTPSSVGFIPWHSLERVRNKSIQKTAKYHDEGPARPGILKREQVEVISRRFSLKYVLAIMNSEVARNSLRKERRSNIHLYPDDWKRLSLPDISRELQDMCHNLVDYVTVLKTQTSPRRLQSAFLDQLIDGLVYELYFPDEIKKAGKELLSHLGDLPPITDDMSEEEKLAIIQREFDRLYDPRHPVRNHLETLDSVDVVRTIREALK